MQAQSVSYTQVPGRCWPSTRRALWVIAEALFYRQAPVPDERLAWLTREACLTLEQAGPRSCLLLQLGAWAVVWLGPLTLGLRPGLSHLPVSARVEVLSRLEDSAWLAAPVLAVKVLLCTLYYEQPAALVEIGFASDCKGSIHAA